jgi:hypothetical protein
MMKIPLLRGRATPGTVKQSLPVRAMYFRAMKLEFAARSVITVTV